MIDKFNFRLNKLLTFHRVRANDDDDDDDDIEFVIGGGHGNSTFH